MGKYENSFRCLMSYPWDISVHDGARVGLLSHAAALREIGAKLDIITPSKKSEETLRQDAELKAVFERFFSIPQTGNMEQVFFNIGKSVNDYDMPDLSGRNPAFFAAAAALAHLGKYDLIEIHYTRCHPIKELLPLDIPKILVVHDIDSVVLKQEEAVFGQPSDYSLADEVSHMKGFDLVTVLGSTDFQRVKSVAPHLPVVKCPLFKVDTLCERPSPGVLKNGSHRQIILTASDTPFNQMSFLWFWKYAWPQIREKEPNSRLSIVGGIGWAAKIVIANIDPQVEIHGIVADLEPLMRQAAVAIAPYYYGDGVKLKVLTAMAQGVPVVTTSPGLTNTDLKPGREILVADNAADFADSVLSLLGSTETRIKQSKAGLDFIQSHYSSEAFVPYQKAVLELLHRPKQATVQSTVKQSQLQSRLGHELVCLLPWTIQRCRQNHVKKVALYGAGSATQIFIPIWKRHNGPTIKEILVTANGSSKEIFCGYPVYSIDEFDPTGVDAIVLSSQSYELDMFNTCRERWPDLPVFSVWMPIADGEIERGVDVLGLPVCEESIPAAVLSTMVL
jgi:hypothetical protein